MVLASSRPPSPTNSPADRQGTLQAWLTGLSQRIIDGDRLTREEALQLAAIEGEENILLLCEAANRIREACCGNVVDLCSIINVKSGNCSENCGFCSQSSHHPDPNSPIYGLKTEAEILEQARAAAAAGAKRFCLVSQGRGPKYHSPKDREFEQILATVRQIIQETNIKPCCALGEVTPEQAQQLKEAGVTRYNHNLEASATYYDKIVSTHTWQDRVDTVKNLKAAGIQACTGGILGMGETWEDRIDLALALRELEVESVPLNLLNPRPGTPLGEQQKLNPYDALKAIAIFRFILPQQIIRYAGGREAVMGELQDLGLKAGINAMLVGHYLTTLGQPPERDQKLLASLGLEGGEAPIPGEYQS
ncbi:biotin synthetase [Synechocystis sp. PCC 6803]|uniref:Biotin synthase n=1 Tax=Synechocystis sp. (strain ATCC 27184 / PCC 6803 / Kazusa) TaxID=1111708 RepID=BIOB_SYNY3|nr:MULTISPECIES: biotin synthase BioB [unclassified Synechocystis]P73538.1 RecName: Full=Biotin synthase [Synechocystis sp. PCC 6803 substr. Kazusa]MBD2617686.1 biotin synthase BioB [Synechocystis sp. FACHB-898]MBD2639045.1 biotin synthase BioB [Synechocystis sp. FACHB-908]MBD2660292.1 biotin synthase BioB [Synechocystis sp. FACHB-929]AGF51267.1 biotin synthetase [Synechocystis sp. PCC 6803]ALJ67284.1 biotin synthase [Synechocystis sp. PCC 6803]